MTRLTLPPALADEIRDIIPAAAMVGGRECTAR
jgi:hypothetical protein